MELFDLAFEYQICKREFMTQKFNIRSKRQPNVIWVFGDQHRAQAVSYRGDPNVYTPNIDNLARSGIRFDNAVSGAPCGA